MLHKSAVPHAIVSEIGLESHHFLTERQPDIVSMKVVSWQIPCVTGICNIPSREREPGKVIFPVPHPDIKMKLFPSQSEIHPVHHAVPVSRSAIPGKRKPSVQDNPRSGHVRDISTSCDKTASSETSPVPAARSGRSQRLWEQPPAVGHSPERHPAARASNTVQRHIPRDSPMPLSDLQPCRGHMPQTVPPVSDNEMPLRQTRHGAKPPRDKQY